MNLPTKIEAFEALHDHKKAFAWTYTHTKEIEKARAFLEQLHRMSGFGLPDGIAELRKVGVEVPPEFDHDAQFLAIAHYSKDQRKKDRQRLIRLDVVLEVMMQMEDSYIEQQIKNPWECFIGPAIALQKCFSTVKAVAKALFYILWDGTEALWGLTAAVLLNLNLLFNFNLLRKSFLLHYAIRDFWCDHLRDRALPQSTVTRHKRVKRTRT